MTDKRSFRRVIPDLQTEPWMDDAACLGVDLDLFFPERGASTGEAKQVCRGCPVREACLDYAIRNNERFGIWGGLSERERRRIRRQRTFGIAPLPSPPVNGRQKLTAAQKDEIAARWSAGEASQEDLAVEYGVSQNTISASVRARRDEEDEAVRVGAQVLDLMKALRERTAG